jgi:hypothetical protein
MHSDNNLFYTFQHLHTSYFVFTYFMPSIYLLPEAQLGFLTSGGAITIATSDKNYELRKNNCSLHFLLFVSVIQHLLSAGTQIYLFKIFISPPLGLCCPGRPRLCFLLLYSFSNPSVYLYSRLSSTPSFLPLLYFRKASAHIVHSLS